MAKIVWGKPGERQYETGVDRGVFYPPFETGVPWNGIVSVSDEPSNEEPESYYIDGIKYLDIVRPGDFQATLEAFTYPKEFEPFDGLGLFEDVITVTGQNRKTFSLSYRTRIGDDIVGLEKGYKIHLLYNLLAIPSSKDYSTLNDSSEVMNFSWTLVGTPVKFPGLRPSAHAIIDTRKTPARSLALLEQYLYGSEETAPKFPTVAELIDILHDVNIYIYDNKNGTWTAEVPDELLTWISDTEFQIDQANAVYLDANTYEISNSIT